MFFVHWSGVVSNCIPSSTSLQSSSEELSVGNLPQDASG